MNDVVGNTTSSGAAFAGSCASCGKPAPPARAFCGSCGARLWEPCLECGTSNSVAERFCSRCGTDLVGQLAAAQAAIDEKLTRAAALEKDGKLLEAVDVLADVAASDHSRLMERLVAVVHRRQELANLREKAVAERGQKYDEARRLQQERKYAAAYAVLQQVPSSLRNQETRNLLAEIEHPLSEIKQHRAALAKALKNSHPESGLPHAERLVELEPNADDVRRVCLQLRERKQKRDAVLSKQLLIEARDAIASNKYSSAAALLDKLPPTDDEADRKLQSAIEERVWMARQVAVAPYADETLRGIAARLVKLQPKDLQAAKAELEIATRLARSENRAGRPFVPWARAAGPTRLGPAVEPVSNVAKLHWDASSPQLASWTLHLRRHLVAAGLALAGIGAATLDLEFDWGADRSWLGRLTGGIGRRRAKTAWGLDFGTSGLKFVRLVRDSDVVSIDRSGIIDYAPPPQGAEQADLQLQYAPAFEKFRAAQSPGDERIVVGFPGAQTLGRFFALPRMNARKFSTAIEFEVGNQIPLPADEVVYAAHVWNAAADDGQPHQIILAAAKQAHAALRASALDERKSRSYSLQSECVALLNLLLHVHADQIAQLNPSEAIVLVDVGNAATNVVAVSPARGPWFRTIHRGVRSLNRPLVEAFGVTWQQAQELRQKWPGPRPMAAVDKALARAIDELSRDFRRALEAAEESLAAKVVQIYVSGGGCDQFGLLREWAGCEAAKIDLGSQHGIRSVRPPSDRPAAAVQEASL